MSDQEIRFEETGDDVAGRFARAVLGRTALCLKLATMHHLANAAMTPPVRGLLDTVNPALEGGESVLLQAVGDNIFLNRQVVKLDASSYESAATLRAVLQRLTIQEIGFTRPVTEAELRAFLEAFQRHYRSAQPAGLLREKWPSIHVRRIGKADADAMGGQIDERQNVVRCYALLAVILDQVLEALAHGRPTRMAALRRAVQELADAAEGHEALLAGLTRSPNLAGRVSYHLAATGALVLLMGRRLRLERVVLVELVLAALLHDLGRGELPEGWDAGALDEGRLAAAVQRVPLRTMLAVCAEGVGPETVCRLVAAWEHALPASAPLPPGGMARLVSVACAFDLLTNPAPPRRALLPDQALRVLLDRGGTQFDAAATRLFAATVGLYPVGTAVRLSGGQLALVVEVPADPADYLRPRVKVVRDAAGPADHFVDLAHSDLEIVESVDAAAEELNAPAFLLA